MGRTLLDSSREARFVKTLTMYLCISLILSIIIFMESYASETPAEYLLLLGFRIGPIIAVIPLITFTIAYIFKVSSEGWAKSFILPAINAIGGILIMQITTGIAFSLAISILNDTSESVEYSGLYAIDSWSDFFKRWIIPVVSAGVGGIMSKFHRRGSRKK